MFYNFNPVIESTVSIIKALIFKPTIISHFQIEPRFFQLQQLSKSNMKYFALIAQQRSKKVEILLLKKKASMLHIRAFTSSTSRPSLRNMLRVPITEEKIHASCNKILFCICIWFLFFEVKSISYILGLGLYFSNELGRALSQW